MMKQWTTMQLPVHPWPHNHGIGLRTGEHIGIDFDIYDQPIIDSLLEKFRSDFDIITRIGMPPKVLVPAICAEITDKLKSNRYVDENGVIHMIEILSRGQMYVAYAIHPDTQKPYRWSSKLIDHKMPVISKEYVDTLFALFYALAADKGWIDLDKKKREHTSKKTFSRSNGSLPGDWFNAAYPIENVLRSYGWQYHGGNRWTRPGKNQKNGPSATVFDNGTVYVFSTSIPELEANECYDAFGLYARYEFNGDFSAAAKEIRKATDD